MKTHHWIILILALWAVGVSLTLTQHNVRLKKLERQTEHAGEVAL